MASKFVRLAGRLNAVDTLTSTTRFSGRLSSSDLLARPLRSFQTFSSPVRAFNFSSHAKMAPLLPQLHLKSVRNISTDPKVVADAEIDKRVTALDIDEAIDLSSTLDKHWFTLILDAGGDVFNAIRETLGLSWVPFIFLLSGTFRMLFFPFTLNSIRSAQTSSAKTEQLSQKMREAMANKNLEEAQKLRAELLSGAFSFAKTAPILAQGLIMTGVFLILRNLALTGAHNFSNAGLFWFKDLTAADPTMLLPVLGALTTFLLMRTGFSYEKMASSIGMNIALHTLPILITVFTFQLPASCLVYIIAGNTFTICQNLVMKIPAVKDYLGISNISNLPTLPPNTSLKKPTQKKTKSPLE
jgi:membrane protein insertase Oxa1/YidC/SpoIIIJ